MSELDFIKINKVEYLGGYKLELFFSDGFSGIVDFEKYLWGKVFLPLKDKQYFKKVKVDKDSGTVCWPNGADIAPDTLYCEAYLGTVPKAPLYSFFNNKNLAFIREEEAGYLSSKENLKADLIDWVKNKATMKDLKKLSGLIKKLIK